MISPSTCAEVCAGPQCGLEHKCLIPWPPAGKYESINSGVSTNFITVKHPDAKRHDLSTW